MYGIQNNPVPLIKAKGLKSQNFPERKDISESIMKDKPVNNRIIQRFLSVHEMKQKITYTKGHHGWNNLNQISNVKRAIREDSTDKSIKASKECKGMGAKNKRIYLS